MRVLLILAVVISTAAGQEDRERYAHDTVLTPVVDLIRLETAAELGNRRLAEMGFVDVTATPFKADSSGRTDSTSAIQRAVNFARDHQMVCFFPPGVYMVSDTISCIQGYYRRQHGKISGAPNFPCVLVGSRSGSERPRIVLAENSTGFSDPQKPKYVVHFWARGQEASDKPQPNISFNQMFVGIDISLGKSNPGAVGIRHRAAQGSAVQDCTIYATGGLTGLEGGAGSGGSHAGITVVGGQIGMDLRQTQPAPTIIGIKLIGQTGPAILNDSRQALCAVGMKIVRKQPGPAIVNSGKWNVHFQGQIVLVDSDIEFDRMDDDNVVIEAERSFYFHNVRVKNASVLAELPGKEKVAGRAGWLQIQQYAQPIRPIPYRSRQYSCSVFVDGKRQSDALLRLTSEVPSGGDVVAKHLWSEAFPGWEDAHAVNVRTSPHNAKGDGVADDTNAIQRAIDDKEIVFLPKGIYRVKRTLKLRDKTKLIGVGRAFSIIAVRGDDGFFTDAGNPKPVIETVDDAAAETTLAFCGIYVPYEVPGAYALRWRAGAKSFVRDVDFLLQPGTGYGKKTPEHDPRTSPFVVVTGNGGGKWYNWELGKGLDYPGYRQILIDGTSQPLAFYQCCPEGARSEANMEICDSRNVNIYGLKGEGNYYMIWMRNSQQVGVFGYGGNGAAWPDNTLFRVEGCDDFLFAGMVDHPMAEGHEAIRGAVGTDPEKWHMIIETTDGGKTIRTGSLERPILYQQGW